MSHRTQAGISYSCCVAKRMQKAIIARSPVLIKSTWICFLMSALTIFTDNEPDTPIWHSVGATAIRQQLNAKQVRFERWQADRDLGENPQPETVIGACQHAIDKLVTEKGYQSWNVISMRAYNPQKEALRESFCLNLPTAKMRCVSLWKVQDCFVCIWTGISIRYCVRKTI